MNNCKAVENLLSVYALGELSKDDARMVEKHIAECAQCRAEFGRMQKVIGIADAIKSEAASDELQRDAIEGIKAESVASVGMKNEKSSRRIGLRFVQAAAVIIIALLIIQQFTGPIEVAAPAFSDVIDNVLMQKWVYMFEEDRKSGVIQYEYWYNPSQQKIFMKEPGNEYALMVDLITREQMQYRDGKITISTLDDFESMHRWLSERLPMMGGFLREYEEQGAVVTQNEALYNKKKAWLYEVDLAIPSGNIGYRIYQNKWLVDTATNLPIICEYRQVVSRTKEEFANLKESIGINSSRYAFDYCDEGPADIYALGVPEDAEIVYEDVDGGFLELVDKINEIKEEKYHSFASISIESQDYPKYLIIRKGEKKRQDYIELAINGSDFIAEKDKYLEDMGDSFDSVYRWINKEESIVKRNSISISDEQVEYRLFGSAINGNISPKANLHPSQNNRFFWHCWRNLSQMKVVEDEYSKENNLICCMTEAGNKYYYDPEHNYFCVRTVRSDDNIGYEITEIGKTESGMLYPKSGRSASYHQNEDKTGTYLAGYSTFRIYARDMNESLEELLDPRRLPNFVDHRELTRKFVEKREAATASGAEVVEYSGFTPLHMAIYREDIEKVKQYLGEGMEVESDSDSGATPMELAVATGNLELVKLLYENGADFYSNDEQRRCCLGLAAENGHIEVVELLLGLCVDIDGVYKEGNTALHYAAENGDVGMVEKLIADGAEIDVVNNDGETALYRSVRYYSGEIHSQAAERGIIDKYQKAGRLLVESGADINHRINVQGHTRRTILQHIVNTFRYETRNAEHHLELVAFLLGLGADPDLMTASESPLYIAFDQRSYDIVKLLLDNGADPWLLPERTLHTEKLNYLFLSKQRTDERMFELMYPYMKEHYEETNTILVESAKKVMEAILSEDTEAIKRLCIDHPYYYKPWEKWSAEIKELYAGHEEKVEDTIPGWFTLNGFADVFVPLPEELEEKSIGLGFLHYPDGSWKCMSYQKQKYLPEFGGLYTSNFIRHFSRVLQEYVNYIYDEYGADVNVQANSSGSSISNGNCIEGTLVIEAREEGLGIYVAEQNADKRWIILTAECMKRYATNELAYYADFTSKQKDGKVQVTFEPLKCTIESSDKKYTFTLEDGNVVFDDGQVRKAAERFAVKMPEVEIIRN